jgi:hypothetical protein
VIRDLDVVARVVNLATGWSWELASGGAICQVGIVGMNSVLRSSASWGMICCLLAAISPAFPWSYWTYQDLNWVSAYSSWQGAAISVAGGTGALFLLATGGMSPAPWWRILGIAMIGTTVLVFLLICATHHWIHFPLRE